MKKIIFLLITTFLNTAINASTCRITGEHGGWKVEVDGKPYEIKGAGCGNLKDSDGINYLAMAKELGATAVRTWGTDQGTEEYLNTAEQFNLKVLAGVWYNHCNLIGKKTKSFSYINNQESLQSLENDTISYVKKFQKHPAIIMWNLGNEVLSHTIDEDERIAFCRFLESIIQKVKKIDSDHPVVYSSSSSTEFTYLRKYVPSLDIIGVNTYGSIEPINNDWKTLGFNIPFLITEAGPKGFWDMERDQFGLSLDQADYEKSFEYQLLMEEADRYKGSCLGVFIFHLGDTTQDSLTWWNVNIGKHKREAFHIIHEFFTKTSYPNKPPVCTDITIDKNIVKPGEKIHVLVKARDRENDKLSYDLRIATCTEAVLQYKVNTAVNVTVIQKNSEIIFLAPHTPGLYRLHVFVYDTNDNVATRAISFKVS